MDTCVLVIDMQNGFCHERGSAARAGMTMKGMDDVVAEHVRLLDRARVARLPIIFTRYGWRTNGVDVDPAMAAALGPEALRWGSWDAEIIDELPVDPADTVIDKPRFDCFLYTELDLVLRGLGAQRLLLTGTATNGCVETTARTATQLGYRVAVAEDATSALEGRHRPALTLIAAAFGEVVPWRAVIP